eukprot:CAMPEP_0177739972 /NCGR_PEP_ID=MMETSP0484_2-20121128/27318_1 /TAXON_ID=354590 /ORGANISM="Rhodomonas lens, Strain RHODO" /LENGTH=383 /DNA_ID=CAMNT_0019254085 /DNA_START=308 /DNA_END=1456 /DNA_ORIENTATION=+
MAWKATSLTMAFILSVIFAVEVLFFLFHSSICEWRLHSALTSMDLGVHDWRREGIKVLLFADAHILGYRRRLSIDVAWSDWGLMKAVAAARYTHQPELEVLNGDVFDEGDISSTDEFKEAIRRYRRIFGGETAQARARRGGGGEGGRQVLLTVGNHDIGNQQHASQKYLDLFEEGVGPANAVLCLKNQSFVTFNTQVLAPQARAAMRATALSFLSSPSLSLQLQQCSGSAPSRPILIGHMPLYRSTDEVCGRESGTTTVGNRCQRPPPDPLVPSPSVPTYCHESGRGVTYKAVRDTLYAWDDDVLGQEQSTALLRDLQPSLVISGHTHAPCRTSHVIAAPGHADVTREVPEVTLPPLGWRMRPDAGYAIAVIVPANAAVRGAD